MVSTKRFIELQRTNLEAHARESNADVADIMSMFDLATMETLAELIDGDQPEPKPAKRRGGRPRKAKPPEDGSTTPAA